MALKLQMGFESRQRHGGSGGLVDVNKSQLGLVCDTMTGTE